MVDDNRVHRDWGASAPRRCSRTLGRRPPRRPRRPRHRRSAGSEAVGVPAGTARRAGGWQGTLVAVTGTAGAGASTVAAALTQGLGDDPRYAGVVVLADLALDAHQAVLHDAGDVVPGLPELVDAHRLGQPSTDEVRRLTFAVAAAATTCCWASPPPRLGPAPPRAMEAALAGSGAGPTGSSSPTSTATSRARTSAAHRRRGPQPTRPSGDGGTAEAVVVVGQPGTTRLHALVRLLDAVLDHGVAPADGWSRC